MNTSIDVCQGKVHITILWTLTYRSLHTHNMGMSTSNGSTRRRSPCTSSKFAQVTGRKQQQKLYQYGFNLESFVCLFFGGVSATLQYQRSSYVGCEGVQLQCSARVSFGLNIQELRIQIHLKAVQNLYNERINVLNTTFC